MFKKWLCAAAFSAAALLLTPGVSSAQRRVWGGGWGSGWWGGNYRVYDGNRSWYGWPYYYGYYGYRPYYSSYTTPYYYGYYGYTPYYSSYVTPYYSSYATPSYYSYIEPSATPSYYYSPPDTDQNPNVALMEVRVPANAEIWFEGEKTSQTGAVRHFQSPELQPGRTFTYDIRARWTDAGGKEIDRAKQVRVQAGARVGVDFNNP